MAPKRRLRYEDTGPRKCRKIFHAKLKESHEKLCLLPHLSDRASNTRGTALNTDEDVRPLEACQTQETTYEGAAADQHVSHIDEHDSDTFGELSQSINMRGDDEELSLNDRVLCYALYVQHCGFSMEEVRMMEKVWGIIYGKPPPFTYQDKVIPLKKQILSLYNPTRLIFCASCKNLLRQYRDMCENPNCLLYKCHLKRAKGVQRSEVYLINMVPQLSDLLESEIREIIDFHRHLHRNNGGPALDRSDVRFFESFYQGIETVNDFGRNRLKIVLSLSIDGFVPKRLTRREVWPIYLRVDNLHKTVADNYYNSILCGVYFSFSKPSSEMLECLFSRLESEIRSLEIEPLMIEVDGVTWIMNVEIQRGIADMGAQRALFGLPHWESSQGCSKCYITGERINNHRVWICREGDNKSLRNPQSFFEDGATHTNGVPGVTPVMRIVTPSQFLSDALHVCSEGVTKDRLRDMISSTSKFASLKLSKEAVDNIKSCLMRITSHTYSRAIIHSVEVVNMGKAKEIDEVAFIVFPLAASTGIISSPIASISLLGYWLCIRIVHESRCLTAAKIGIAQQLAALTKRLWIAIAPEVFTMKTHWFFDHAMCEEIALIGTAYQWSSAPFEGHHARLQVRVDQYTRNSPVAMIERYLVSKKLRTIFENRFSSCKRREILDLKMKIENRHLNRLPLGIYIDDCMYIPAKCWVAPAQLQETHKKYVQGREEAYSRLVINGKPYSSREYWRQSIHSRQDMVYIEGNEHGKEVEALGCIKLFLYNRANRSLRVLLEEWEFCDPFEHLNGVIRHTEHPLQMVGIELLNVIREHNIFFYELKKMVTQIRPASFIRRPCIYLEYGSHKYASITD